MMPEDTGGRLIQQGLDLILDWPDYATVRLQNWHNTSEGVKGELTVTQNGTKYHWSSWNLASASARTSLVKILDGLNPEVPWRAHFEEAAFRFTMKAREGEPLKVLTGQLDTAATEVLLPGWFYAGLSTLLYADGDTGKSMTALAFCVAMSTGRSLPAGLTPTRSVHAAYLDWETSESITNERLRFLANGFGIPPPPVLYKHMTRPLVEEIGPLSMELAHRKVGLVVIDSKMFAVRSGDGAAFHEPITAFYNACRLFSPAAVLVLNHITNADARTGSSARPFGGAFAFNGPRVVWEAKRDHTIEDATAIVFTNTKANHLARKSDSFGLAFRGADKIADKQIRIEPLSLTTVDPAAMASLTVTQRIRLLLSAPLSVEDLVDAIPKAKKDSVSRILRRMRKEFEATELPDGRWIATTPTQGGQIRTSPADNVRAHRLAPPEEGISKPPPGADGQTPSIGVVRLSAFDHEVAAAQAEPSWIHTDPPEDTP